MPSAVEVVSWQKTLAILGVVLYVGVWEASVVKVHVCSFSAHTRPWGYRGLGLELRGKIALTQPLAVALKAPKFRVTAPYSNPHNPSH